MNVIARVVLFLVIAAGLWWLALWLTETVHLDCRRSIATQFSCTFESTKRGATKLYQFDEGLLQNAEVATATIHNNDGTFDEKFYLKLRLANGGSVESSDGDRAAINSHANAINAFLRDTNQSDLRFTMTNRNYRLALAGLVLVVVGWGLWHWRP